MKPNQMSWKVYGGIIFFCAAYLSAGSSDFAEELRIEKEYCENVYVWRVNQMTNKRTDLGHPDFKSIYSAACSKYEPADTLPGEQSK